MRNDSTAQERAETRGPGEGILLPLPPLADDPLVSVLITNFNYVNFIGEAIESVQRQSYGNTEVIVCDDGSTDDSCKVVKRYLGDGKIKLVRKENGGHGSAINRAFAASSGSVVCILDADDLFAPGKIAGVVDTFRTNLRAGLAIHDLSIIDGSGRKHGSARYRHQGYLGGEIATLRLGLPMPQSSGLSFRREVLEKILPLPEEEFRSAADWAIAYTAAFLTHTAAIPKELGCYRIHGSNLSGTTSTASTLDEIRVGKNLAGMERVIAYVDRFMRDHFRIPVEAAKVRNILEHRLIVGFLRRDEAAITAAASDLRAAYRDVRRDYPAYRYCFWQTLSQLDPLLARSLLLASFRLFTFKRLFRFP